MSTAAFKAPAVVYTFTLPGPSGTVYTINSPGIKAAKKLLDMQQKAMAAAVMMQAADQMTEEESAKLVADMTLDDADEVDYYRLALGATLDEIEANDEPYPWVTIAAGAVVIWLQTGDIDEARRFAESGGRRPKARTPQDRKPKTKA